MQNALEFVVAQNGDAGGWTLRRQGSNERPLVFPTKEAAMAFAGSEYAAGSNNTQEAPAS